MTYSDIIDFWFNEIDSAFWWKKDLEFDQSLVKRFKATHDKAKACELYAWREAPLGRLAEIIVLDQFSRNMYRDKPEAFAQDPLALALAQEAVALGQDKDIDSSKRSFLYMPYMHSESLVVHDVALKLFENSPEFEIKHRNIIERFGRYPHRNLILGRTSTKEETEFLNEPDSSF